MYVPTRLASCGPQTSCLLAEKLTRAPGKNNGKMSKKKKSLERDMLRTSAVEQSPCYQMVCLIYRTWCTYVHMYVPLCCSSGVFLAAAERGLHQINVRLDQTELTEREPSRRSVAGRTPNLINLSSWRNDKKGKQPLPSSHISLRPLKIATCVSAST